MKLSEAIAVLDPKGTYLVNIQKTEGEKAVKENVDIAKRIAGIFVNDFLNNKSNAEKYPDLFYSTNKIHNIDVNMQFTSKLLTKETFLQTMFQIQSGHSHEEVIDIINGCLVLACDVLRIELEKQRKKNNK